MRGALLLAVAVTVAMAALWLTVEVAGRPVTVPAGGGARPRLTMEPPVNLSHSPGVTSARPRIARTTDGTLHVVWEEGDDVRHVYQLPGQPWGPNPPLTVYYGAFDPALTAYGGLVATAFSVRASQGTDTSIRLKQWDGQSRWGGAQAVHGDGQFGQQPALAFEPNDASLWVVWVNNTFGFRPYWSRVVTGRSPESGSIAGDSQKAQGPSVAVDLEGGVWVAWKEEAQPTGDTWVTCRRKAPGGGWGLCSARTDVMRGERFEAFAPDLALDAPGACVTWHNGVQGGKMEVYLACEGGGWVARNQSQSAERNSLLPRLAAAEAWGPLVLWEERSDPRQILFRRSGPPPEPVTEGVVAAPDIAFETGPGFGYAHAVWQQIAPDDPAGEPDVYYARWRVDVPTPTPTATITPTPSTTPTATITPTRGPGSATPTPSPRRVFAPFVAKPFDTPRH